MNGITETNDKPKKLKSEKKGIMLSTPIFILVVAGAIVLSLGGGILIGRYLIPKQSEFSNNTPMNEDFRPKNAEDMKNRKEPSGEKPEFDDENRPELPSES